MNARFLILSLALALAPGFAAADDKKADEKKSEEKKPAKAKAGKKDKNVFQKMESDVGNWADRNNVWNRKSATAKKN